MRGSDNANGLLLQSLKDRRHSNASEFRIYAVPVRLVKGKTVKRNSQEKMSSPVHSCPSQSTPVTFILAATQLPQKPML